MEFETDPPPKEPDWRCRHEEDCEHGLCIEWNTRRRQFWIVRQTASGSEDYVDVGVVFEVAPGDGREAILENLRLHTEHLGLDPDVRFKAIEVDPHARERQGRFPEWFLESKTNSTDELSGEESDAANEEGASTEDLNTAPPVEEELPGKGMDAGPLKQRDLFWATHFSHIWQEATREAVAGPEPRESPPLRSELKLARCKQCEHVFLKDALQGSSTACDRCGSTLAWQFTLPARSQDPARQQSKQSGTTRTWVTTPSRRFSEACTIATATGEWSSAHQDLPSRRRNWPAKHPFSSGIGRSWSYLLNAT